MLELREESGGIVLRVKVMPKSASNEITGIYNCGIKLRLTAAPVESKANEAGIRFLSRKWNIPRRDLAFVAGTKSRNKLLKVRGLSKEELLKRINLG